MLRTLSRFALTHRSQRKIVPTYSEEDIELIAAAIDQDSADVAAHAKLFETAARWFRLGRGLPQAGSRSPRRTPSQLKDKLRQISQSARRLLKHLGVPNDELGRVRIEDAYNGPGDFEILQVLSWAVNHDEDPVVVATRRIGRLAELLEAIEAANGLEQWAEQSAEEVIEFGQLTVPKGHRGDMPLNDWIAAMLVAYKRITGKDPATSVGAPERDNEGVPGGPLLRFLEAAGKPLGIELTPDAWRNRVRGLLGLDEN
jgi:hypothetical protein